MVMYFDSSAPNDTSSPPVFWPGSFLWTAGYIRVNDPYDHVCRTTFMSTSRVDAWIKSLIFLEKWLSRVILCGELMSTRQTKTAFGNARCVSVP